MTEKDAPSGAAYCRQRAAPDGSNLHYCLLYAPPARRRALLALHAYEQELAEAVLRGSDPGVARLRLAWWREQLRRSRTGRHDHPVMQELHALREQPLPPVETLAAMIDAHERRLQPARPESLSEMLREYCAAGGALWRWTARLCGPERAQPPAGAATPGRGETGERQAEDLGCELGCLADAFHSLQHLRQNAAMGRLQLPLEWLRGAGIETERLAATEPRARQLAAIGVEAVRRRLETLAKAFPRAQRRRQLPCLILARLLAVTCREIAADGYRLLERRVALTPLRKLWLAWRMRRLV